MIHKNRIFLNKNFCFLKLDILKGWIYFKEIFKYQYVITMNTSLGYIFETLSC